MVRFSEWERKLEELTNQFDEEMNKKTSYKKNKNGTDDSRVRENNDKKIKVRQFGNYKYNVN